MKDTDQLILPFFKSEKTMAFSDAESMLLTDTSCWDPNDLILPLAEKAGNYHIIRSLKKYRRAGHPSIDAALSDSSR